MPYPEMMVGVFYDLDKQGHKVLGGGWIVN